MILNENYFDDLKLTDDDIESSDNVNHNTDGYANIEEYYNAMSSKYSNYIVLGIKTDKHILTDSDLWNNKIPRMLKKLFYLFDLYGIEYSTPVVSEPDYRVRQLIDDKLENCKFFDFHGYKLITTFDNFRELSILLFFNPPKTQSYTTACKFIGNTMRILWKNEDYDTFVNSFCVYNFMSYIALSMYMYNPYTHKFINIDKTSIAKPDTRLINILKLFFPKKKYNDIKNVLTDKQLLLKLYKCFPDY